MGQYNTSTQSRQYTQLSKEDRTKIEAGLKRADTRCKIAKELGRSQSTIDKESEKGDSAPADEWGDSLRILCRCWAEPARRG
ncbi:MAG: helix-turn-helix domain-containing protein [Eubacteriaceae bacterium]|nr:helix-turn-helix domain-containing protein [Eubacteriaceae bacterium]